jgi:hypothetical protein
VKRFHKPGKIEPEFAYLKTGTLGRPDIPGKPDKLDRQVPGFPDNLDKPDKNYSWRYLDSRA